MPPFSIYRNPHPEQKRKGEAEDIRRLLLQLQTMRIQEVTYGADPPDFVFELHQHSIGVELTSVLPKPFGRGGYRRKSEFAAWREKARKKPNERHEFEWGTYKLRDSFAAFDRQMKEKCERLDTWRHRFSETWLLMHVASGSAFSSLVASQNKPKLGKERDVAEYHAKIAFHIASACSSSPFDYVIFFSGDVFTAFTSSANPHKLPVLDAEFIAQGAKADDRYLDWTSTPKTVVEPW